MSRFDIAVIGAGMAGASLAAELAPKASVLLIEAEEQPGFHATGRSAAFWHETYGGPLVQPLTRASRSLLSEPPAWFSDRPFLHRRGGVTIARAGSEALLEQMRAAYTPGGVEFEWLARPALEELIPGLKPGWNQALAEPACGDIDVAGLHAAYLRQAKRAGVELVLDASVTSAHTSGGGWKLATKGGEFSASILVNAAGAWADDVARIAGCDPLGIQPFRRVDPPAPDDLPLVLDAAGQFYFKPEAGGRIWLSPHDETPCPAGDCAPEELDIAIAIDRLQQVVDWNVERVERAWAGLRSFAPDRLPVYGFAEGRTDFFWFAGQGGFGIQTAPAAAKLGAALLLGNRPEPMVAAIDPRPYSPSRFAN
jgi:D-arginine dehydrogenase